MKTLRIDRLANCFEYKDGIEYLHGQFTYAGSDHRWAGRYLIEMSSSCKKDEYINAIRIPIDDVIIIEENIQIEK